MQLCVTAAASFSPAASQRGLPKHPLSCNAMRCAMRDAPRCSGVVFVVLVGHDGVDVVQLKQLFHQRLIGRELLIIRLRMRTICKRQ